MEVLPGFDEIEISISTSAPVHVRLVPRPSDHKSGSTAGRLFQASPICRPSLHEKLLLRPCIQSVIPLTMAIMLKKNSFKKRSLMGMGVGWGGGGTV